MLSRAGHDVHTFAYPVEAQRFTEADPSEPDFQVTDRTMPGMTGDERAPTIRAIRSDLPVLILTGVSDRLTEERLDELRAVVVLQKLVALPSFLQTVRAALTTVSAV